MLRPWCDYALFQDKDLQGQWTCVYLHPFYVCITPNTETELCDLFPNIQCERVADDIP